MLMKWKVNVCVFCFLEKPLLQFGKIVERKQNVANQVKRNESSAKLCRF